MRDITAGEMRARGVCIRNRKHPLDALGFESLTVVARRAIGVAILRTNTRRETRWTTCTQRKTKS